MLNSTSASGKTAEYIAQSYFAATAVANEVIQ
jgi:hypothetical protein